MPQAKETPPEREITYICDFRRCRLNVRLSARIQPLLPDHKYRLFLFLVAVFGYWSRIRIYFGSDLWEALVGCGFSELFYKESLNEYQQYAESKLSKDTR